MPCKPTGGGNDLRPTKRGQLQLIENCDHILGSGNAPYVSDWLYRLRRGELKGGGLACELEVKTVLRETGRESFGT